MQLQITELSSTVVTTVHTRPDQAGTAAFECIGQTPLASLTERGDGWLVVSCPNGCPLTALVPVGGSGQAQRLHARYRQQSASHPEKTVHAAIESVLAEVFARGGEPSVTLALEAVAALPAAPDATLFPQLAKARVLLDAQKAEREAAKK